MVRELTRKDLETLFGRRVLNVGYNSRLRYRVYLAPTARFDVQNKKYNNEIHYRAEFEIIEKDFPIDEVKERAKDFFQKNVIEKEKFHKKAILIEELLGTKGELKKFYEKAVEFTNLFL